MSKYVTVKIQLFTFIEWQGPIVHLLSVILLNHLLMYYSHFIPPFKWMQNFKTNRSISVDEHYLVVLP